MDESLALSTGIPFAWDVAGVAASIIGLPLAMLLWCLSPERIRGSILRLVSLHRRVDVSVLAELELDGLIVKNRQLLQSVALTSVYRSIFWPVVPGRSPNLVHLAFIRYLVPLRQAGFRITMFVFDDYAATVRGRPADSARAEAELFVASLMEAGLSHSQPQVVYQSSMTKVSRRAGKVLPLFLTYLGRLEHEQLEVIRTGKPSVCASGKVIGYVKPILNMTYLLSVKGRFGFTLSGYDEEPLWRTFSEVVPTGLGLGVPPVTLYIPVMTSTTCGSTHALDQVTNIAKSDSDDEVRQKVGDTLSTLRQGNAVSYAVDRLLCLASRTLKISHNSTTYEVASSEQLADLIDGGRVSECEVVMVLSREIRDAFRGALPWHDLRRNHLAVSDTTRHDPVQKSCQKPVDSTFNEVETRRVAVAVLAKLSGLVSSTNVFRKEEVVNFSIVGGDPAVRPIDRLVDLDTILILSDPMTEAKYTKLNLALESLHGEATAMVAVSHKIMLGPVPDEVPRTGSLVSVHALVFTRESYISHACEFPKRSWAFEARTICGCDLAELDKCSSASVEELLHGILGIRHCRDLIASRSTTAFIWRPRQGGTDMVLMPEDVPLSQPGRFADFCIYAVLRIASNTIRCIGRGTRTTGIGKMDLGLLRELLPGFGLANVPVELLNDKGALRNGNLYPTEEYARRISSQADGFLAGLYTQLVTYSESLSTHHGHNNAPAQ